MFHKKDALEYFVTFSNIQDSLLEYIDYDDPNDEEIFKKLMLTIENSKFKDDKYLFKELLYCISKISLNHHRDSYFLSRIEKILLSLKDCMLQFFSNHEIFKIFKYDKRVLLFLFNQQIVVPDKILAQVITDGKFLEYDYPEYFYFEFKDFYDESFQQYMEETIDDINNFEEKRKIGENDNYICDVIRKDLIDEFIVLINQNKYKISSKIEPSIFETNKFLLDIKKFSDTYSLAEYSLFFGSMQIFKYLFLNNVEISDDFYTIAIHSQNPELFHFLEENIKFTYFNDAFIESIKCYHTQFSQYMYDNLQMDRFNLNDEIKAILKYFNFYYLPIDISKPILYKWLCDYDYYSLVKLLIGDIINYPDIKVSTKNGNHEIFEILCQSPEIKWFHDLRNTVFLTQISHPQTFQGVYNSFYKNCIMLKEIDLPSTISYIGYLAFSNCISLVEISIPDSVSFIDEFAFKGCTSLKYIFFSPSSSISRIDNSAFNDCISLEEIEFPSSLQYLGYSIFEGCSSLKKIKMPNGLISLGKSAFSKCVSLQEITIPFSLTYIPPDLFYDCESLKKVTIPSSITIIESNAFTGCTSLQSIDIPSNVTSINYSAFKDCSSLKEVTISSSITSIPIGCFYGCSAIEQIIIPSSVTIIGELAFYGCSLLNKISLPPSLKSIGKYCFAKCSFLIEVINYSYIKFIDKFAFEGCMKLKQIPKTRNENEK